VRNRRAHAPYYGIGHHSRQAAAQAVPGDRGIEPHAGDNAVRFSRHPGNSDNQKHPGQDGDTGGHITHCRDQEFQEYDVEYHHRAHGAEHPAPALENVGGKLAAAHGKGQRRKNCQKRRYHITLRNLKKEFYELPHYHDAHNDDQQPRCAYAETGFFRECDCHTGRNLEQVDDPAGNAKPDLADLLTDQEEKAKYKCPGEQQLRVLTLEAKARRHALDCLKHHVSQEQRPARRDNDGENIVCHRGNLPKI